MKMTATRGGSGLGTPANPIECCMCGDYGFSQELFQCQVCQFRSQHRYCSNVYPKAESSRICNWCLTQKQESKEKSLNTSSSSCRTRCCAEDDGGGKKKKPNEGSENHGVGQEGQLLIHKAVNKKRSSEADSSPATPISVSPLITSVSSQRRIITRGRLEEKLRRTRSDDGMSTTPVGIRKPVLRNRARRYKLLEEVSS